jgi:acetyl esterase/lipase
VTTAVRWLRAHAADLDIDPGRIAVSGNSSGGHLALMVAAAAADSFPVTQQQEEWSEHSGEVSAVCAFYPPTRLHGLDDDNNDDTVATLLGADAKAADYENASPLCFAAQQFPPVLLLSGSDDERVPVKHTYELHEALRKAGNTVELHVFASQGHAFDADREMARVSATIMVNFFQRYV